MADRYAYIPFVGLFIAVVWGLADWASIRKISPSYLALAVTIWTFALALCAHAQMKYWANTKDLWSHTLQVTGSNFVAGDNLGAELLREGEIQAARERIHAPINIHPQEPVIQLTL